MPLWMSRFFVEAFADNTLAAEFVFQIPVLIEEQTDICIQGFRQKLPRSPAQNFRQMVGTNIFWFFQINCITLILGRCILSILWVAD